MKKAAALLLSCLLLLGCCARAEGVTLKTTSIFAGNDAAADTYLDLLKDWEARTGNIVQDSSSTSDEDWKNGVLQDFAAGNEADVLFFFARTADSALLLNKVVPIHEINAAYPQLHLPEDTSVAEADGVVYAIPARSFWEALFCNVDLFENNGIELPTTWEKLETAIRKFQKLGITPIALSFSDVPHYIAEYCILAAGPLSDHLARPRQGDTVPKSWVDAMALIRRLDRLGAFPENANATTNDVVGQMFLEKKAAMQLEGSWFANGIPVENMDSTIVMPFPAHAPDANPQAFLGGVSMGFYLSRAAWDDPAKRDAAVDLLAFLTTGDNAAALGGFNFSGRLLESTQAMLRHEEAMNLPMQDAMDPAARSLWFTSIAGIAEGTVDPTEMWRQVMALDPFPAKAQPTQHER